MNFQLHPDLERDGILIGEFPLCKVLLINDCTYPWFVLVPRREDIRDTTDLPDDDHATLWAESKAFGVAIMEAFQGEKLNVAALGNITPQLHIHHVVRFSGDAAWPGPIWGVQPLQPYDDATLAEIRSKIVMAKIPGLKTDAA